jgi:ribosomal protein L32
MMDSMSALPSPLAMRLALPRQAALLDRHVPAAWACPDCGTPYGLHQRCRDCGAYMGARRHMVTAGPGGRCVDCALVYQRVRAIRAVTFPRPLNACGTPGPASRPAGA